MKSFPTISICLVANASAGVKQSATLAEGFCQVMIALWLLTGYTRASGYSGVT